MQQLPVTLHIFFGLITGISIFFFYKASKNSKKTMIILLSWVLIQSVAALFGFYLKTDGIPPRFALLLFPPLIFITMLFVTQKGRAYIDELDIKFLTLMHFVRLPVELGLFGLCLYKVIPQLMTFEGNNFDILSGISAPLVLYFGFIKKRMGRSVMIAWNIVGLLLLANIVTIAVLSGPFEFQQLAFDQPNTALLYFPFVWLPCCIVPLVLLSHLAAIRQLLKKG